MSEDITPELLAEMESLAFPTPNAHYLRLEGGSVRSDLPAELASFILRASGMLAGVLASASPAQVYEDDDHATERIGDLVELDSQLRSGIGEDFSALATLFSSGALPSGSIPQAMRAVNRLRLAFSGREDQIASAGRSLCSMILADLLELWAFV